MALNATSVLVLELHRYKDTVRGGALVLALGGPRTLSGTTDATLDCAFVENAHVFVVLKSNGPSCPLVSIYKKIRVQISKDDFKVWPHSTFQALESPWQSARNTTDHNVDSDPFGGGSSSFLTQA